MRAPGGPKSKDLLARIGKNLVSDPRSSTIYNTHAPITLVYLSVSAPTSGCELIPLKFAGPYWEPAGENLTPPAGMAASGSTGAHTIYLPALSKSPDLSQCPCGYFNAEGQMIGYVDR